MAQWFECKVRYDKTLESGIIKKVTESYLVDALSFTEAEKRFIEEIEPFMSGEYVVSDIRRANLSELFESEDLSDDRWFKAKIAYITIDEKKGVEKTVNQLTLIQAKDLETSLAHLKEGMRGTLGDWKIVSIAETKIIDIFKYKVSEDETVGDNQ